MNALTDLKISLLPIRITRYWPLIIPSTQGRERERERKRLRDRERERGREKAREKAREKE